MEGKAEVKSREIVPHENGRRYAKPTTETRFASFLRRKQPHSKIRIEPHEFRTTFDDGTTKSTVPDIYLEKKDGTIIYIEITHQELNGTDPKEKQKELMRTGFPDTRYVVLYQHNLQNITDRHGTIFGRNGRVKR